MSFQWKEAVVTTQACFLFQPRTKMSVALHFSKWTVLVVAFELVLGISGILNSLGIQLWKLPLRLSGD